MQIVSDLTYEKFSNCLVGCIVYSSGQLSINATPIWQKSFVLAINLQNEKQQVCSSRSEKFGWTFRTFKKVEIYNAHNFALILDWLTSFTYTFSWNNKNNYFLLSHKISIKSLNFPQFSKNLFQIPQPVSQQFLHYTSTTGFIEMTVSLNYVDLKTRAYNVWNRGMQEFHYFKNSAKRYRAVHIVYISNNPRKMLIVILI